MEKKIETSKNKLNKLDKLFIVEALILLALVSFNLFNVYGLNNAVSVKLEEIEELRAPAKLEMIIINVDCNDCFSLDSVISRLKNNPGVEIVEYRVLDSSLSEAKALVEQYGIEKLPTIVLRGEINKTEISGFEMVGDALVYVDQKPPYVDAKNARVVGLVSAAIIKDTTCDVCYSLEGIVDNLKQNGVVFSEIKTIDFNSTEAKELIEKYGIVRVPALLLSTDIDAYPIANNLKQTGIQARDGYYVFETQAPYVDAKSGEIKGLVTLIMINDSSCNDCYDVRIHKQILVGFGLAINEEKIVDVNSDEGQDLINRYNITKVPTVILTGDVGVYEAFKQIWAQVGTIEEDGAYVFRNMNALRGAVYRELT